MTYRIKSRQKFAKKKVSKKKIILIIVIVILSLILLATATFFTLDYLGKKKLESSQLPVMEMREDEQANYELVDEKTVVYNGKTYVFNESIKNILLLGVDSKDAAERSGESMKHQADVIVICSIDEKKNTVRLINVSRETMADIQMYSENGEFVGMQNQQIALAYSYLDGTEKSSLNTVQAVSDLFYGIPIHAYCTVFINAVRPINDAVGGVDVVIPTDMTKISRKFVKGKTVHLEGDLVMQFLRARSALSDSTNDARMERHKIYIKSFIPTAIEKTKKNVFLPLRLYNLLSDYVITDISADEILHLSKKIVNMDIDYDLINLPGKSVKGEVFTEKHLDEKAFFELVLDNFYTVES